MLLCATVWAVCADDYTSTLGYVCTQCNVGRRNAAITVAAVVLAALIAMVAHGLKFLGTYGGQTAAGEVVPTENAAGVQLVLIGARASQALKAVVVSWPLVTQASTG